MSGRIELKRAAQYDLVLTGGRVLDKRAARWTRQDIAVQDRLIVDLADEIDPAGAAASVDVTGLLVTPGLIDLHVHSYPGATYWGIAIDDVSLAHGVTTVVDAGSAGAHTFAGLELVLRSSRLHGRAFLNIAGGGLSNPYGELLAPALADVEAAVRVAREHPDLIVGFKLRASPNTVGDYASAALSAVREAADEANLPVMVHVSESPPLLAHVLAHLREGDILTHCFTPYDNSVVDEVGIVKPEVGAALERGVLLDVGHGSGSFSFGAAEAYVASGLRPPIISTDLHKRSVLGPAFNMSTVMTKMLAAGYDVGDVMHSATSAPASVLRTTASLDLGSVADIAVFEVEDRPVRLWDSRGIERVGDQRLTCRLTVLEGKPVFVDPAVRLQY